MKVLTFSYILIVFFIIQGCTSNFMLENRQDCLNKSLLKLDDMLTNQEKKVLKRSENIVKTHKFGMLKFKIIKLFHLIEGDSCLARYYSKQGITQPILMSELLLEKYKAI